MDIIYEILKAICSGLLLLLIAIWNGICWLTHWICSSLWEYKEEIFYGICSAICYVAKGIWWLVSNILLSLYNLCAHLVKNFEFGGTNTSSIIVYFIVGSIIIYIIYKIRKASEDVEIAKACEVWEEKKQQRLWGEILRMSPEEQQEYCDDADRSRREKITQIDAQYIVQRKQESTYVAPQKENTRHVQKAIEESYVTKDIIKKTTCALCSSSMYGPSCQYSSIRAKNFSVGKVHMHSPDGKHCVYCGSTMVGLGCPYSPSGTHSRMN